jgi:tetratricopeptide (TPR) repeat protein
MVFVILIALSASILAVLWRLAGVSRDALTIIGAGLALGCAGYSLQGAPDLAARPVVAVEEIALPTRNDKPKLMGEYSNAAVRVQQAENFLRAGQPRLAMKVIQLGLDKDPNNAALLTGLGNTLVSHGGGLLSPAAEHVYRKALREEPDDPATLFFYGLALASNDRIEDARVLWRALLAVLPKSSPQRAEVERIIASSGIMNEAEPAAPAPSK